MLNKKIEEALNAQINAELWSAYLYLSMAAYAHANGNPGMGNWFEVQFKEEQDHAKIMFNYIIQRGGRVELKPIEAVPTTWESPLAVFEATLARAKSDIAHQQSLCSFYCRERLCNTKYAQMVYRRAGGGRRKRTKHHRQSQNDSGQRLRTLYARQGTCRTHIRSAFAIGWQSIAKM